MRSAGTRALEGGWKRSRFIPIGPLRPPVLRAALAQGDAEPSPPGAGGDGIQLVHLGRDLLVGAPGAPPQAACTSTGRPHRAARRGRRLASPSRCSGCAAATRCRCATRPAPLAGVQTAMSAPNPPAPRQEPEALPGFTVAMILIGHARRCSRRPRAIVFGFERVWSGGRATPAATPRLRRRSTGRRSACSSRMPFELADQQPARARRRAHTARALGLVDREPALPRAGGRGDRLVAPGGPPMNDLLRRLLWLPDRARPSRRWPTGSTTDLPHRPGDWRPRLLAAGSYFMIRYRYRRHADHAQGRGAGLAGGDLRRRAALGVPRLVRHRLPRLLSRRRRRRTRWTSTSWASSGCGSSPTRRARTASNVLRVPAGRPVRLLITSRDVIHSSSCRRSASSRTRCPGRYTQTWFEATEPGTLPGAVRRVLRPGHSKMRAEVVVLAPRSSRRG